jgi:hypothetical protein
MKTKEYMMMVRLLVALLAGFVFFSTQAKASDPRIIGTFDNWSAYMFTENGNKVCYMASKPINAEGDYSRRDDIYALITHRPAEGTRNVFSYITGYPYKENSEVEVVIGGDKFVLFTQDDTAWAPDAAMDNRLTDAIKKGVNMVVKGTSTRGTLTTDTFSLRGSGKAYEAISKECGV